MLELQRLLHRTDDAGQVLALWVRDHGVLADRVVPFLAEQLGQQLAGFGAVNQPFAGFEVRQIVRRVVQLSRFLLVQGEALLLRGAPAPAVEDAAAGGSL